MQKLAVLLQQNVELRALNPRVLVGGVDIDDRLAFRLHRRGLIGRRQKAVRKVFQAAGRHGSGMQQHIAGQILIFAAERIIDPGAETRVSADIASRMHQQIRARMQRKARDHGADNRDVVHAGGDVRKQLADRNPGLPMLREFPRTLHPFAIGFLLGAHLIEAVKRFSIEVGKFRLRIESIDVRDPAGHVTENDVLYFGSEMRRRSGEIRVGPIRHESGKSHQTEAVGGSPQDITARQPRGSTTGTISV